LSNAEKPIRVALDWILLILVSGMGWEWVVSGSGLALLGARKVLKTFARRQSICHKRRVASSSVSGP